MLSRSNGERNGLDEPKLLATPAAGRPSTGTEAEVLSPRPGTPAVSSGASPAGRRTRARRAGPLSDGERTGAKSPLTPTGT
eukprot:scaffold269489_cov24-Tisochrysis_lutea.AAC.4